MTKFWLLLALFLAGGGEKIVCSDTARATRKKKKKKKNTQRGRPFNLFSGSSARFWQIYIGENVLCVERANGFFFLLFFKGEREPHLGCQLWCRLSFLQREAQKATCSWGEKREPHHHHHHHLLHTRRKSEGADCYLLPLLLRVVEVCMPKVTGSCLRGPHVGK